MFYEVISYRRKVTGVDHVYPKSLNRNLTVTTTLLKRMAQIIMNVRIITVGLYVPLL